MSSIAACLSRKSDEWCTPAWLFRMLDDEFHFNFDAAATPDNTLTEQFSGDGLHAQWGTATFCNPPYSRVKDFILKAWQEARMYGKTTVLLIPSRTCTKWWHDYVMRANEIWFIVWRLQFVGGKSSAPFPSCIVVFRGKDIPLQPFVKSLYKVKP